MSLTTLDLLAGRAPDGEYEDPWFVYQVKDGQVTMTGKPIPFIWDESEGKKEEPGK